MQFAGYYTKKTGRPVSIGAMPPRRLSGVSPLFHFFELMHVSHSSQRRIDSGSAAFTVCIGFKGLFI
jgi:hypothetical protein